MSSEYMYSGLECVVGDVTGIQGYIWDVTWINDETIPTNVQLSITWVSLTLPDKDSSIEYRQPKQAVMPDHLISSMVFQTTRSHSKMILNHLWNTVL